MKENEKIISVGFEIFRAAGRTPWDTLLSQASAFATQLGRENIINISHSSEDGQGTVVVWYFKKSQ